MTNDYGNLELHTVLLSAMKDIDKICRENGLRYYLYAGTLLGAVNHGGFIPWDDDIDLVMFPEDLDRLAQIIREQYSDRYEFSTFDTDPQWFSKMNKLFVKGTAVSSQHSDDTHPIFIDISKLHNFPDSSRLRTRQRKQIEYINKILAVQSGEIIPTSLAAKLALGIPARLSKRFWGKCLDKVLCRYDRTPTEHVGIMCNTLTPNPYTDRSGYDTDMTQRIWHETPQDVPFEGHRFMTFSGIEDYLTYQFGPKWREPYPEEKRRSKHDVKSYEISPEVRARVGL